MKRFKLGIIGCGFTAHGAGSGNQNHLPSLVKMQDDVELAAFCDLIEERARESVQEFGSNDTKVYTDYREMLNDDSLDIVHVCVPNKSHAEVTIAALESGKHVCCEKPMAKTHAEAVKMLEVSKNTGKKLTIHYQYRFRPDSLYLKEICKRGELGDIYFAKAHALRRRAVPTWGVFLNEEEQGGGSLIDLGTHALDMTLWMMDNYKPESVMGSTYNKFSQQTDTANFFGNWDPSEFTVEDSAFGFIKMENGATIYLESSWALNILEAEEAKTTLCGTKAGADMKGGLRINKAELGRLVVVKPAILPDPIEVFDAPPSPPPGELFARAWIDCIKNDTEPIVLPEQAIIVTQILEAIYKSSKTGEPQYF